MNSVQVLIGYVVERVYMEMEMEMDSTVNLSVIINSCCENVVKMLRTRREELIIIRNL